MKRFLILILCICICCSLLLPASAAEDSSLGLIYDLTADGSDTITAEPGSIITVCFRMRRGDGSGEDFSLRILQNEILYDQDFFRFVEDSIQVEKSGGSALFQTRLDGTHIIKASFLSSDGSSFGDGEAFCSFRLQVVGSSGEGWVRCDRDRAKAYDGDNEACTLDAASEIRVRASGDCHPFTDVLESDWFHEAVDYVYLHGLMNGVDETHFEPMGTMTRAMLVTVLYRLSGSPEISTANPFTDVADGQWYTDAILWANDSGIVTGYGEGLFGTNDSVTREQIATILYRYARSAGYDVGMTADLSAYADASAISSWAVEAMGWANAAGLISGRTADTLVPGGTANRAEVATVLMRFCKNVLE